jgi:hypothetical protein
VNSQTKRRWLKLAKSNVESFYDMEFALFYSQTVSPKVEKKKEGVDYSTSTAIWIITESD